MRISLIYDTLLYKLSTNVGVVYSYLIDDFLFEQDFG